MGAFVDEGGVVDSVVIVDGFVEETGDGALAIIRKG